MSSDRAAMVADELDSNTRFHNGRARAQRQTRTPG